jgi:ATP-binding cassette subfamily B multidrug efflux pump
MLAISVLQIARERVCRLPRRPHGDESFGRDTTGAGLPRVVEFSAREVSQFGAPTLISRTTNDVQQVQMVVFMTLAMMVGAPIMMVGGVIMALRTDVGLSWLIVAVAVLGLSVGLLLRQMLPRFRVMQDSIDSVNRILREQITGIRVVRAFVREPHEQPASPRPTPRSPAPRSGSGGSWRSSSRRHARAQRVDRRGAVVRRAPRRRRATCRSAR